MEGTPLRRFGHYLVTQPRRGKHPHWFVYDTRTEERVLYSECRESADEGARRLATGRPLYTPDEALTRAVERYPTIYPSRLRYYDHVYLTNGNGLSWVSGGIADTDVTDLTAAGVAMLDAREALRQSENREDRSETMRRIFDEIDEERRAESDAIKWQFAAGTWPDARGSERLCHASVGCPMHDLTRMTTTAVDPAWLMDARHAMRLLLAHGTDGDGYDTLATLRVWAAMLSERHGGSWLP
jgi:hypothetical protein